MDSAAGKPHSKPENPASSAAWRLALAYAAFALAWILFSDYVAALLFSDPAQYHLVSTVKGGLFVAVTTLLLYGLIKRYLDKTLRLAQREKETLLAKVRTRQLLSDISDNSHDIIFAKDLEGRYLLFNREASKVTGKAAELVLGCDDSVLFPKEQADMLGENDRLVIRENQVCTFEEILPTVDGEVTYLCIKGPLSDADGHVYGVFGISRDISERKRMENALRRSEERLLIAQESAHVGIWEWDVANGRSYWSPECERLYGFEPGSLKTNDDWRVRVHPDDLPLIDAQWETSIEAGKPFEVEFRFNLGSGGIRWLLSKGKAHYDANGVPIRLFGINMDVSERHEAEEARRASEERYRTVFQTSLDVIAINRLADGVYIDVNQAFLDVMGYSREEVVGRTSQELNIWSDLLVRGRLIDSLKRDSPYHNLEACFNNKRGEPVWGLMSAGLINLDGVPCILSVTRDITDRRKAEEQLHLAASVFTHAREGIVITAPDGAIMDVNDAFSRITGYSRQEVLGRNPRILNSGRQSREFYAGMWHDLIMHGHWSGEVWNKRKNGEVFPEMLTISAVRGADGEVQRYVALFSDISSLKRHEQQLEYIAHFDALTGLPNRILLADRLHQAMAQASRRGLLLAVAYLDLDGFKAINDRHGHDAGDQLLTALSGRMKQALREGDTFARLGGDEFVAVLLDLPDTESSVPMLARLLEAAAEPVPSGELSFQVSASIGVSFYPQSEEVDADQLLRQADQAMYQAKLAGKNRYHLFDPEQDRSTRGHHESLEHIRRALTGGEFVLHYQPKVNMRTGAMVGAEALIRWQHPERGLLAPAVFLPVIEDHPLSIELGEWVIRSALNQLEEWRGMGLHFPVSINVGALQLQQSDFVQRLRDLLAEHPDIEPFSIELEVLETSALQDVVQISKVIEACRAIGVTFALDDFGTGYSSLTYLKRLPAHVLKIDQSFVRDMLDDPEELAILEGVLGLATAFRRQAVAEGVETIEHGVMLLQLGCDLAQGYGIARPMPAGDIQGWLSGWRPDARWANVRPLRQGELPALFAGVEHRAWIRAVEAVLKGESKIHPPLEPQQCRFGAWLAAEAAAGQGLRPELKAVEALHDQVHALAAELLDLHGQERAEEAMARLGELHRLRDELLMRLGMAMV
ncbi:MAG TPA: EAL domain-containing protein [Parasulfuritortus sp.]